jgi:phenylpropionate dioxygenase-like ring-hydroxylating dioxygenase large terminal subunit
MSEPNARPVARRAESLAAFQRFPKNCWYVAAGGVEVGRRPLGRKLLGTHVVLFRKENGDPVAMEDHCPHRGYRFSDSKLLGDSIQCGYHGMVFNSQGQCTKMTGAGAVPPVMRVRTYPVVEKRVYIWIWIGDPDKADPALIPPTPYEDRDDFHHVFYYPLPFAGNFQLAQDNLLDATHVSYLHANLLDNEDKVEFTSADEVATIEGNDIKRVITMTGFVPNESVHQLWHVPIGKPLKRVITVVNHLPCAVNIRNEFFDMNDGGRIVSERVTAIGLVPADRNHAYHFTAVSSSFPQTDEDKEAQLRVLNQDIYACEQIQKHFEEDAESAVEISVQTDKLGITSRRLIDAMVRKEEGDMVSRS